MPQLLPLSRAARLVGVSRGELQKRIRHDELATFEGMIKVSDLLRVFPEARLQDDSAIERTERIKALAAPRSQIGNKLPSAEVLARRLTEISRDLTESKTELGYLSEIVSELQQQLLQIQQGDPQQAGMEVSTLKDWLEDKIKHRPKVPKRKTELLARDNFLRLVAARVHLIPSDHEFFVEGSDSLLEAGLRSGLALKYGCTRGSCSKCKARVISGEVLKMRDHDYRITDTEHNLGYILMCSYTAVTDVVIEADEARASDDIPTQTIDTRVKKITRPNDDLAILHLTTPDTQSLRFLAGQSVELRLSGGDHQRLSLASCPCDGSHLEFHLWRCHNKPLTAKVLDHSVSEGDTVSLSGPEGDFVLLADSTRPVLFFAYDDGFSAIKSLIESAISIDNAERYHLYWIASEAGMHYMENRCRSWNDALDNFDYSALQLPLDTSTEAITEYLQQSIGELGKINRYDVYIVAPPHMIAILTQLLAQHGLSARHIFSNDIQLFSEVE
jgi:CDP-4-dehydro-6-deoxyglucose reductase